MVGGARGETVGSLRFAEKGSHQVGTITTSGTVTGQVSTNGNPQDIVAATNASGAPTGTDFFTNINFNSGVSYCSYIDPLGLTPWAPEPGRPYVGRRAQGLLAQR